MIGSELADIDINIVGFELGFESVQEKLRTSQRTESHGNRCGAAETISKILGSLKRSLQA